MFPCTDTNSLIITIYTLIIIDAYVLHWICMKDFHVYCTYLKNNYNTVCILAMCTQMCFKELLWWGPLNPGSCHCKSSFTQFLLL